MGEEKEIKNMRESVLMQEHYTASNSLRCGMMLTL